MYYHKDCEIFKKSDTFTDDEILNICQNFDQISKNKNIAIARDTKCSGFLMQRRLTNVLLSLNFKVFVMDICNEGCLYFAIKNLNIDIGIIIFTENSTTKLRMMDKNGYHKILIKNIEQDSKSILQTINTQYDENFVPLNMNMRYFDYIMGGYEKPLNGVNVNLYNDNGILSYHSQKLFKLSGAHTNVRDGALLSQNAFVTKYDRQTESLKGLSILFNSIGDKFKIAIDGKTFDEEDLFLIHASELKRLNCLTKNTVAVPTDISLSTQINLKLLSIDVYVLPTDTNYSDMICHMAKNQISFGINGCGKMILYPMSKVFDALLMSYMTVMLYNKPNFTQRFLSKKTCILRHHVPISDDYFRSNMTNIVNYIKDMNTSIDGLIQLKIDENNLVFVIETRTEETCIHLLEEIIDFFN